MNRPHLGNSNAPRWKPAANRTTWHENYNTTLLLHKKYVSSSTITCIEIKI